MTREAARMDHARRFNRAAAPGATGDTDEGGRTLLQRRLALYGAVLSLINAAYWGGFLVTYGREPQVGFEAALRHTFSVSALLPTGVYLGVWLAARGRPLPMALLRAIEVVAHALYGAAFAISVFIHPSQSTVAFEVAAGVMFLLIVRALLVPSSARFTLLLGMLICSAPIAAVAARGAVPGSVGPATLLAYFANWCIVGTAVSAVASGVLYGLRRQVLDARRLGQYTLDEKLGEGGMGVVYRAHHAMLRRPTAIKLISARHAPHLVERFEQEVQLMARMSHPNIVTVHDYGRTAAGTFYYAMELLDGLDLERLIQIDGPQRPARVIHILSQVCRALAEAHEAGLVHRDIKPANLFLCRSWGEPDAVKVLDFGLVKDLGAAPETAMTSLGGGMVGTPLYMAPECFTDPVAVDSRSDLYALGAVAYYLLSGHHVFSGKTPMEVSAHHIYSAPLPLRGRVSTALADDLERVVMRLLAKSPAARASCARRSTRARTPGCGGRPTRRPGGGGRRRRSIGGAGSSRPTSARTASSSSPARGGSPGSLPPRGTVLLNPSDEPRPGPSARTGPRGAQSQEKTRWNHFASLCPMKCSTICRRVSSARAGPTTSPTKAGSTAPTPPTSRNWWPTGSTATTGASTNARSTRIRSSEPGSMVCRSTSSTCAARGPIPGR
jgi:eukaryotic-like serine/threonine-protein kinase